MAQPIDFLREKIAEAASIAAEQIIPAEVTRLVSEQLTTICELPKIKIQNPETAQHNIAVQQFARSANDALPEELRKRSFNPVSPKDMAKFSKVLWYTNEFVIYTHGSQEEPQWSNLSLHNGVRVGGVVFGVTNFGRIVFLKLAGEKYLVRQPQLIGLCAPMNADRLTIMKLLISTHLQKSFRELLIEFRQNISHAIVSDSELICDTSAPERELREKIAELEKHSKEAKDKALALEVKRNELQKPLDEIQARTDEFEAKKRELIEHQQALSHALAEIGRVKSRLREIRRGVGAIGDIARSKEMMVSLLAAVRTACSNYDFDCEAAEAKCRIIEHKLRAIHTPNPDEFDLQVKEVDRTINALYSKQQASAASASGALEAASDLIAGRKSVIGSGIPDTANRQVGKRR